MVHEERGFEMGKLILKKQTEKKPSLFNPEDIYTVDVDALAPYTVYKPSSYRDGPEGFINWCNDAIWYWRNDYESGWSNCQ